MIDYLLPVEYPRGSWWRSIHNGFIGEVIGWYVTREGKRGVVLQMADNRVVHVYNTKFMEPHPSMVKDPPPEAAGDPDHPYNRGFDGPTGAD